MEKSLNAYASRIVHIVGQPDNNSLKERVKSMIKDYYAKYIIQSTDRNGIDDYYKISLLVPMIPDEDSKKVSSIFGRVSYIRFISSITLPKPLHIKSDAPFTRVSIPKSAKIFSYRTITGLRMSSTHTPTRCPNVYSIVDNKLIVERNFAAYNLDSELLITQVEVEGLWESPEEVIGFYLEDDNQDIDLPLPREMMSFIIAEILKVEFNIVPIDTEVDKK